jgi:polynucleotide 5'-kinase involved in rRNA processing
MTSKTVEQLSSSQKSRKLNMRGWTRRRARMVLRDLARSVAAELVAAAKIINKKGPLGAVTRSKKTMAMMRTTSPASMSFRKLQRPCASTVVPRCTHLIASSSSGHVRSLRQSHHSTPRSH